MKYNPIANNEELKIWRILVFVAGFIFSLGLYLLLKEKFVFEFHQNPDVYGWIAEHQYPKQQDFFYYLFTLTFVPICIILFYFLWILLSRFISRLGNSNFEFILKREALTYLPLFLILRNVSVPEPSFNNVLLVPIVITILVKIVLLLRDILLNRLQTINNLFFKDKLLSHSIVLASGLCAGFLYLINRSPNRLTFNACFLYLTGICALIWILWILCSFLLQKFTSLNFSDAFEVGALTFTPFSLFALQFILWAFHVENAGLIIFLICVLATISSKFFVFMKYNKSSVDLDRYRRITKIILSYVVIPVLIYALVYNSNIHGGIDMFHEGERIGNVSGMLHGKVPYRDIYLQHGLFQNAIKPFIAMKLFGVSIASDRTMGNTLAQRGLTNPFGYIAAYLLALWLFRKKFVAVMAILLLASVEIVLNDRHAVALLSLAFVAKYISSKRDWNLIAAGIFSGLGIFNSFDTGVFGFVSIILFLAVYVISHKEQRFRPLLRFLLGFSIGFVPVAFSLLLFGALDDFFRVSLLQASAYQVPTWAVPFPKINLSVFNSLKGFIEFFGSGQGRWNLPPIIYALSLTYLIFRAISNRFKDKQWRFLLITFGGIVFFRSALGRSCSNYIYFSMPLCWIIVIYAVYLTCLRCWKSLRKMESQLLPKAFWLLLPILFLIWYLSLNYSSLDRFRNRITALTAHRTIPTELVPLKLKRAGGIHIPPNQASMIESIVKYIQKNTSSDDTVFDFSNHGVLYLLMNRENPTKYYQSVYIASLDMQREAVSDLEEKKTKYVIFHNPQSFHGLPTVEKRQKILYEYVMEKYSEEITINGIQILRRNSPEL